MSEALGNALTVFFLSMLPITELRGSIPYGIGILHMEPIPTLIWGVLGNCIPVLLIIKLLNPVIKWIFKNFQPLEHYFKKYFDVLHTKHSTSFNKWGAFFLTLFVAIPLPGTGAWTGALLAYLFNIPYWMAIGSISLGVLGAGIIVTFFSESIKWIF